MLLSEVIIWRLLYVCHSYDWRISIHLSMWNVVRLYGMGTLYGGLTSLSYLSIHLSVDMFHNLTHIYGIACLMLASVHLTVVLLWLHHYHCSSYMLSLSCKIASWLCMFLCYFRTSSLVSDGSMYRYLSMEDGVLICMVDLTLFSY